MDNLILIDGNSIGYAAHNARELKSNGRQVQAIFFTLKMIKKVLDEFGGEFNQAIILWDSRAKWRYALHPAYKGKRDDSPEKKASRDAYKAQVPDIRKSLALLGLEQMFAQNEEADDLGAALVHNRKPGQKILLVTGDKDWLQMVSDDVSWYDPREEGQLITAQDFHSKTGFPNVVQFSQAKAILGDSSDNIPGVDGLGEKAVTNLFNLFGGVSKFVQAAQAHGREFEKGELPEELSRFRKKLNAFAFGDQMEVFKRNMQLMNLLSKRHRSTDILDKIVTLPTALDEDAFVEFCHENAFMSIARSMHEWRATLSQLSTTPFALEAI